MHRKMMRGASFILHPRQGMGKTLSVRGRDEQSPCSGDLQRSTSELTELVDQKRETPKKNTFVTGKPTHK